MTYPGFRFGTVVTYGGHERAGGSFNSQTGKAIFFSRAPENPDPDLYEWDDSRKGWVAVLDAGDCERVFWAAAFVMYRGYRCQVMKMFEDGTAEILYNDWNGAWAQMQGGFEQREKYEFYKVVPVSELYDYHEEQRDLVFDEWREQSFTRPAAATS